MVGLPIAQACVLAFRSKKTKTRINMSSSFTLMTSLYHFTKVSPTRNCRQLAPPQSGPTLMVILNTHSVDTHTFRIGLQTQS